MPHQDLDLKLEIELDFGEMINFRQYTKIADIQGFTEENTREF